MSLGIVTNYDFVDGSFFLPTEVSVYTKYHVGDVFVIAPENLNTKTPQALNVLRNMEECVDLSHLDVLYFGGMGKNIEELHKKYCFSDDVPTFLGIADFLDTNGFGYLCRNPLDTMRGNFSKRYLLDLQAKGVDVIPTTEVTAFNQIETLVSGSQQYLVKPLIGERSAGVYLVTAENIDEIYSFWENITSSDETLHNATVSSQLPRQGMILQPYTDAFRTYGERKIGVVDGEITIAKHIRADSDVVSATSGADVTRYEPTKSEVDLVERVYAEFSQMYPNWYARVDITGDPRWPVVNEVEAINPDFSLRRFEKDSANHAKIKNHVGAMFR